MPFKSFKEWFDEYNEKCFDCLSEDATKFEKERDKLVY